MFRTGNRHNDEEQGQGGELGFFIPLCFFEVLIAV